MNIGVSSCLFGNKCRYDGSASTDKFIVDELLNYFNIIPYCPEEKIFGTPRDTIRLVENDSGDIKVMTNTTKADVTDELQNVSQQFASKAKKDNLCGFILKSKSPTCGLERVKVYKEVNAPSEKKGVGLFAAELKKVYPYLPIEEEGRLNDPWLKENFIMQIFAYNDLLNFLSSKPTHKDLVEFHTSYKYLIYAKSQSSYKKLGSIVANHDKKDINDILQEYEIAFFEAIDEKGNINKTYNVLLHIFGYFKKDLSKEEKEHILESMEDYKKGIIPLVAVTKILNLLVTRFDQKYLKTQKFLNPYPKEFALRSDIKAYK